MGRNWEEQRQGKLYSDYFVCKKNLCLMKEEKKQAKRICGIDTQ